MALQLYNTLTRAKEVFVPVDASHVRIYCCGPTVYSYAHIGNGRTFTAFDLLARVMKHLYPTVTYARNITDVDDKIMDRAKALGQSIETVTETTTAQFHADMDALNLLRPDVEPRATGHIDAMIAMIERLIAGGHAYAAEGHVLFNVPSMPDYGRLSRRSQDEMIAGARVEVAPYKKSPADFILWKPSAEDQPGWDSPWGRGRPGWHIECSAMTAAHLGPVFDVHGGGLDLIFPHHENEIAQSRCAHGTPVMANYWVHAGFLTMSGDKMSKSLGNIFTVAELLDEVPGEALRLALLQAHYRQPLDFSKEGLRQARATLDRWYGVLRAAGTVPAAKVPDEVLAALEDDLNTPLAFSLLHELANRFHKETDEGARRAVAASFKAAANLMGLLTQDPEAWFRWTPKGAEGLDEAAIQAAIQARKDARAAKNFAEADRIRKDLLDQGVVLEDGPQGTTWKRA
ncbi:cysteine--tRNA ligase [Nitrospirillum viridazoti]|uniref:Cysteine--tRNA ligase n=1 Tax=Nitrospirillum viridazoti CBAmc TaxID=1441467 RepID=A0A248JQX9_9PROT|nr:cysteine--tRNA ligase [Nitrospirillum amazonense]ASG20488.1 cysteine--tRNA ligase [Nitrospirillum amazonense CBAmc]TWB34897.1 cysteinyl-tRNA synthetase [Nitrospirillum amazonense]